MAWYLRWQCKFSSLNETKYSVNIYEKTTGSTTQLEAAVNPFVTYENNNEDIFTPIREQTGYLRVFDTDGTLMEKIVPKNNTEKKVTLTDDSGNVKWQGFLCASAYTQPWDSQTNVIEFPVKSVLAALEDVQMTDSYASSEYLVAKLLTQAFSAIDVKPSRVYVSSDMESDQIYFLHIFLQYAAFFGEETVNNQGDSRTQLVGMSYYECIEAVMRLYGLTIREDGDSLHIAHYDKTNGGSIVTWPYTWTNMEELASGLLLYVDGIKDMTDADLLPSLDFVETNNVAGFLQGARSVKIVVDVSGQVSLHVNLPQTTEDATPPLEVGNIYTGQVFVQPHGPRSGTHESFTYSEYKQEGRVGSNRVGSSTYQKCLENSVIYRPMFDPHWSSDDNLHTGAFPCRWFYRKDVSDTPSLRNGLFLNQQYLVSGMSFTPYYCYSIETGSSYRLSNGFLNINMLCHNFMRGTLAGDSNKLYFGEFTSIFATKPQTKLYCILTWGNKEWNGSSWITHSGDYQTFTISFDGSQVKSNKTVDMSVDETSGWFIPVNGELDGVIKLYILNIVSCETELGFQDAHSRIISDLSIEFLPIIDLVVSHRKENTYRQTIMQSGFSEDKDVSLIIGTFNNNVPSTAFIKESKTDYIEQLSYNSSGSSTVRQRPELRLLNRMANYYSMARRTFMGVVQIGVELMKTRYSYIGKKFFGVKDETNWADDSQTVKFIEVT